MTEESILSEHWAPFGPPVDGDMKSFTGKKGASYFCNPPWLLSKDHHGDKVDWHSHHHEPGEFVMRHDENGYILNNRIPSEFLLHRNKHLFSQNLQDCLHYVVYLCMILVDTARYILYLWSCTVSFLIYFTKNYQLHQQLSLYGFVFLAWFYWNILPVLNCPYMSRPSKYLVRQYFSSLNHNQVYSKYISREIDVIELNKI